nr:MAG TPA: hypothetical protein [Caudoviricetes sp.]
MECDSWLNPPPNAKPRRRQRSVWLEVRAW